MSTKRSFKVCSTVMAITLSATAFAPFTTQAIELGSQVAPLAQYPCKQVYEDKLDQLDRTKGIRTASRVVLFSALGVTGFGAIFAGISGGALTLYGVGFFGTLFGVPAGVTTAVEFDSRHANQIRAAYDAQEIMALSFSDLARVAEEARTLAADRAVNRLNHRLNERSYVEELVRDLNRSRYQAGLPSLTEEQAIAAARVAAREEVLNEPIVVENSITWALEKAKKRGWVEASTSYDEFRTLLQNNAAEFCSNGKARELLSVVKGITR